MKLTARKIRKIRSTLKRFDIYVDSTHKFDFMSLKPTRYVFAHDIDEAYWRFYRRNTKNITSWKQEHIYYYAVSTRREADFAIVPCDIKWRSEIKYCAIGLYD